MVGPVAAMAAPPGGPGGCVTCGQLLPGHGMPPALMSQPGPQPVTTRTVGPILAVGRLRASFPSLGHQREYADIAAVDPDAPIATRELKDVVTQWEHRYLARQICWIFSVQSVDICVVVPRNDADLDELMDSVAIDDENTVHALTGEPAVNLGPAVCWDIELPLVAPVQLLSFTLDELAAGLGQRYDVDQSDEDQAPDGGGTSNDRRWQAMVRDVFNRLTRPSDTAGFNDDDRARTYLALKDPAVYGLAWNALNNGQSLIDIGTRRSVRAGRRLIVVRFTFRHRQTHVLDRYQCQVDTTDLFCFKATPLTPFYD
jgi:hypothetical protein